jgi:maltoporin
MVHHCNTNRPLRRLALLLPLMVGLIADTRAFGAKDGWQVHGRQTLSLAYSKGRTNAECFRLQDEDQYNLGELDCGRAETYLYLSRYVVPQRGSDKWVRAVFDVLLSAPVYRNWADTSQSEDEGLVIKNSNLYLEASQVLGDGKLWVGNRRYLYEDLWLTDTRILDAHGPGLGLYDIDIGLGSLAVAMFRITSEKGGPVQDTLDIRWRHVPTDIGDWSLALLATQTGATDAKSGSKDYTKMNGWQAVAIHQAAKGDLEIKSFLQYGRGLFGAADNKPFYNGTGSLLQEFGSERDPNLLDEDTHHDERQALKDSFTWRLGSQWLWLPKDAPWSLFGGLTYAVSDFGGLRYQVDDDLFKRGDMTTLVYTIRPQYDFSDIWGLEWEYNSLTIDEGLGLEHQSRNGTIRNNQAPVDRRLERWSMAVNYRPLGWGSPEIKLFYSQSRWNPEISRDVSDELFEFTRRGYAAGVLTQFWW